MLLLSQYLVSSPLKTIPRFLHQCCLDQGKTSYHLVICMQLPLQKAVVVGSVGDW